MKNSFLINRVRTYKARLELDQPIKDLNSFINKQAARGITILMLAEQTTDRTWNIDGVDHPNYDTVSEFKRQFPKVNPKDAMALLERVKKMINPHAIPKLKDGKPVLKKDGTPATIKTSCKAPYFLGLFKGTSNPKKQKEFAPVYKRLKAAGLLPLFTAYEDNCGVDRAIIDSIINRLSSFFLCDAETQKQYEDINNRIASLHASMSEADSKNITDLCEFAKKKFCTNDENVARFISKKFVAFLKHVYNPNVDLDSGRYFYVDEEEKKHFLRFTVDKDIMKFINKRNGLADAIVANYESIELYDMLSRYKSKSRITIPHEVHSPVDIHCGSNFITHKFTEIGGEFYFGDVNNKIFKQQYKMNYKKDSGVYQMMNLSITPLAKPRKNKKEKYTNYNISFDVNDKHHREGQLNECFIQVRGNDCFLNLTFGDSFYSPFATIYSSGIKKASARKNQNYLKKVISDDKCIRCFGVDLGMNPNFGWSVVESYDPLGKNTKIVKSGVEGASDYNSYFMTLYFDLMNNCKALKRLLNLTNDIISNKESVTDYEKEMVDDILGDSKVLSRDEVIEMIRNKRKPVTKIKKTWCLKKLRKHIISIFGKMKDYRRHNNQTTSPNEAIYMIDAINFYIAALTKYNKIGYFNPDKSAHTESFRELWEYRDNLHEDALKKLAACAVLGAVQNKCHFIAVENLELMFHKQKGGLANIFAYGEFKDKIQQIAAMHDMPVVEVDPTATSQIHPVTGEWGYRKIDEYDGDFIAANGKRLDSDGFVAASNIAKRALCFHTDLKIIKVKGDGDSWQIDSETGTRVCGMLDLSLTDSFKLVDGKIIENSLVVSPKDTKTTMILYKHNDKWLDRAAHEILINSIVASKKAVAARK